jgi:integrase
VAHIVKVPRKSRDGRAAHAWKVRYLDPDRVERARTFSRRADAESFANSVETDKRRGEYIDPRAGRITVRDWAQEWLGTARHLVPSTQARYASLLRTHILPRFGSRSLASVRQVDVRRFVSELTDSGSSASTVRQVRHLLGMIFKAAVENGALARSPVVGVKVPRDRRREMQVFSADQVAAVAESVPERYRALVYLLAYGGLRWGEAAALRRSRCNLLRSRVDVVEAVSEVAGELYFGATKTYQVRSVAIPGFLRDMLAEHMATYTADAPDALVFTAPKGGPLRISDFRNRVWRPALEAARLPRTVRIHDMRHTCASLLIARGASVKVVQSHLGHSSAVVTLDTYAHLMPDEQERAAAALDDTFRSVTKR